MRCFISVDLDDGVKDYLFNLQKEFSKFVKAKWVEKKNLHQTLKFLGEVDDEKFVKVKELLKDIKFKRFKVYLKGAGVFPSENFAKVIWVGLASDKILDLQRKIDESLLELFPKDQRFTSHVTLGRVKFVKDKEKLKQLLSSIKVKRLEFYVYDFKLYKSELMKDGPRYSVLEVFSLV